MRTFYDHGDIIIEGVLGTGALEIPKNKKNADYAGVLALVQAGAAEIVLYVKPLAAVKSALKGRVKARAEQLRSIHITQGHGKALEYREKVAEVQRYDAIVAAGGTPQAADFPLLNATRLGRGLASLAAARNLINTTYVSWVALNASILTAEDGGCRAIEDAADTAAAQSAFDAIIWP